MSDATATPSNGHALPGITCKELRKVQDMKAPHLIVDIRDRADYDAGHVEGSIHIPFGELEANVKALAHDRNEPVVIIGERSEQAEETFAHFKNDGFTHVRFLLGGFDEWCKPATPDISDVLEEIKEDEEFLGDRSHHEDDLKESEDQEPLL